MSAPLSRRDLLARSSTGFGLMALNVVLAEQALADGRQPAARLRPRAKHVIFCFMSGGVSHVDSFDPKPRLAKEAGQPMPVPVARTMFNNNGNIFPSPFTFGRHGESGLEVSSMFPKIAEQADHLAVVRSMTSAVSEHAQANLFFHTGFATEGFPSAGAWTSYGLGTMNRDLPSFVVLRSGNSAIPHGGVGMFSSTFLPATHQASFLQADNAEAVRNVQPRHADGVQRRRLDLIRRLGRGFASKDAAVEAAVHNLETAYRMQSAVPELCDLSGESKATRELYGVDDTDGQKAAYARQALLARRLVERGVRFIELSCLTENIGAGGAGNPWDQHSDLERGHGAMAHQVDQPIAALIRDLEARGLLDETIIVWAGEFGRTPFSQGSNGRDHNPFGFSVWLAGGGVQGGTVVGQTDEYGYHVVGQKHTVWDLWATVLHLLGLDHELLTYRFQGRDIRLSDVHGQPIDGVMA
ncbi:MAG: DUF1501 domain-containing protein [Planctomycetota bacterium]|nr:DUF1501 domain-containing protein [Planctomycetota bacterium]